MKIETFIFTVICAISLLTKNYPVTQLLEIKVSQGITENISLKHVRIIQVSRMKLNSATKLYNI